MATTPVFLPGESNQVDYSPWGNKRVRHDLVTKQQQKKLKLTIYPQQ